MSYLLPTVKTQIYYRNCTEYYTVTSQFLVYKRLVCLITFPLLFLPGTHLLAYQNIFVTVIYYFQTRIRSQKSKLVNIPHWRQLKERAPVVPLPGQVLLEGAQRERRGGHLEPVGHLLVQERDHHHRVLAAAARAARLAAAAAARG